MDGLGRREGRGGAKGRRGSKEEQEKGEGELCQERHVSS